MTARAEGPLRYCHSRAETQMLQEVHPAAGHAPIMALAKRNFSRSRCP